MASLKDVAQEADVSIATVSRFFNNSNKVKAETRERVLNAVKALSFQPSRVARRLRAQNGQTHLLGLIIPDIQNPFYSDVARGVEDVAHAHDYALLICNSDEDTKKEKLYIDIMRAESVDGVILPPIRHMDDKTMGSLIRIGLPTVCVDRSVTGIEVDTVTVDNRQGVYDAIDLLIRLGHRRIGFISGLPYHSTSIERRQGYEHALAAHGLALDEELICIGDSREESGRMLTGKLLNMTQPPTALFTSNNLMTLGALEAIQTRGLSIPDDVAIIGFDDISWATLLNPPLTVVRQPSYEIGRRAADMLFHRIAEPQRPSALTVLKTKLVVRGSCGSAPGATESSSPEAIENDSISD